MCKPGAHGTDSQRAWVQTLLSNIEYCCQISLETTLNNESQIHGIVSTHLTAATAMSKEIRLRIRARAQSDRLIPVLYSN